MGRRHRIAVYFHRWHHGWRNFPSANYRLDAAMSEKPKPVDAWGLFMRGKKIPFEVFETKQAAIWRAEVFYLDYNEKVSVIPVTITAKEE